VKEFCTKIRHASRGDALDAAVSAKTRRRRNQKRARGLKKQSDYIGTGAKLSIYKCHVCGFWHWGHRVASFKRKKKKSKNRKWPY